MKGSEHIEQTKDAASKVRSGCFSIFYEANEVEDRCHMLLEPIIQNLRKAIPLQLSEIRPTRVQLASYHNQTLVNIIHSLGRRHRSFASLLSHPELQHKPRRQLPPNTKTRFTPLRATTIEEKSVQGNLENHDDFYIRQMGRDPMDPELSKWAVPSLNDQLTNSRIRSCVIARQGDLNPWLRREIFQLGIAIFHMLMNLIWGLQIKYYGTRDAPGSLVYFFTLMDKKRLAGDKPDYYTLSHALLQILDGIILAGWRKECGYGSLEDFAASNPQPETLKTIASRILHNYCTPLPENRKQVSIHPEPPIPKAAKVVPVLLPTPQSQSTPTSKKTKSKSRPEQESSEPQDVCHKNLRLLARDLLVVAEVTAAIPRGDFGRIEDLLPTLACMFRSVGSNKYAVEIATLLYNLKHIWPPEFAFVAFVLFCRSFHSPPDRNIMRDNHLVNISGFPDHFMAIDMNIEHHIGYVKVCLLLL